MPAEENYFKVFKIEIFKQQTQHFGEPNNIIKLRAMSWPPTTAQYWINKMAVIIHVVEAMIFVPNAAHRHKTKQQATFHCSPKNSK